MSFDDLPAIAHHRAAHADRQAFYASAAETLWEAFTPDEKTLVRFGMFPAERMRAATAAGLDHHALVVALMACASADGGMRA